MSTIIDDVSEPGHLDDLVQCVVKRDRTNSTYTLSFGLGSSPVMQGKFLLVARKVPGVIRDEYEYVITICADDTRDDTTDDATSKGNGFAVVGKLRSNLLRTNFTIYKRVYELHLLRNNEVVSSNHGKSFSWAKIFTGVQEGNFKVRDSNVGQVDYDLQPGYDPQLKPWRMRCTLHNIPASTITDAAPTEYSSFGLLRCLQSLLHCLPTYKDESLVLKSKTPWWNHQDRASCLDLQLVASTEPNQMCSGATGKVLLELGQIGKDTFKMDYRYPLAELEAFAICVSSFDSWLTS